MNLHTNLIKISDLNVYVVQSKWWHVYPFGHETQLNNNEKNISINILDSVLVWKCTYS